MQSHLATGYKNPDARAYVERIQVRPEASAAVIAPTAAELAHAVPVVVCRPFAITPGANKFVIINFQYGYVTSGDDLHERYLEDARQLISIVNELLWQEARITETTNVKLIRSVPGDQWDGYFNRHPPPPPDV